MTEIPKGLEYRSESPAQQEVRRKIETTFGGNVLHSKTGGRFYEFDELEMENKDHLGELKFRDITEHGSEVFAYLTDEDIRWDDKTGRLILGDDWELLPTVEAGISQEDENVLEEVREGDSKSPEDLERITKELAEYYADKIIRSLGDHREFIFDKVVYDSTQKHPYLLMVHQATDEENVLAVDPDEFFEQFRVEEKAA